MRKQKTYLFIAVLIVATDRLFKYIFFTSPSMRDGVFVFNRAFGIKGFRNENFIFGLGLTNQASIILMLLVLLFLVAVFFSSKNKAKIYVPAAFIFLGASSNLVDRIFFGGVIDYIVVPLGGIINLADILIFIGVVLFVRKR